MGITLDQSINLCLINDPVIHAGLEVINQTHGDVESPSLWLAATSEETVAPGVTRPVAVALTPPGVPSAVETGAGLGWVCEGGVP